MTISPSLLLNRVRCSHTFLTFRRYQQTQCAFLSSWGATPANQPPWAPAQLCPCARGHSATLKAGCTLICLGGQAADCIVLNLLSLGLPPQLWSRGPEKSSKDVPSPLNQVPTQHSPGPSVIRLNDLDLKPDPSQPCSLPLHPFPNVAQSTSKLRNSLLVLTPSLFNSRGTPHSCHLKGKNQPHFSYGIMMDCWMGWLGFQLRVSCCPDGYSISR